MGELRQLLGPRPLFSIEVSILLQDEQGRWLLQRRSDSGRWGLPGGGLEPGEMFLQAAARELEEETGLTDVPLTPAGSLSGPEMRHVYPHGDTVYLVGQLYRGTLNQQQFARATLGSDGETLELRFFDLDDLPILNDNIERVVARRLRAEAGRPALPALENRPVPDAPEGEYYAELRRVVGPRPLFVPQARVRLERDGGEVLLLRNADGRWALPGGELRLGETLEACARRTVHADTGVVLAALDEGPLYAGATYRMSAPSGEITDPVALLYRARHTGGTVTAGTWFAPGTLPAPEHLDGPLTLALLSASV